LNDAQQQGMEIVPKVELNQVGAQAESYFNENNYSYEGFCEVAEDKIYRGEVIRCVDTEDSWAILVESSKGIISNRYCADNNSSPDLGGLPEESTECVFDNEPINVIPAPSIPSLDAKDRAAELRGYPEVERY
jgi:hypothetical protein